MKKRVFVCLMVGIFSLALTQAQKGAVLGGFLMPQGSLLLNPDDNSQEPAELYQLRYLPGMAAGGIIGYNFNPYIGIRANVLYSQQGGRYSSRKDFDTDITYSTRLEYAKIPLMVGLMSNPERKVSFFLYGGYQLGFLTRAYRENDDLAYEPAIPANTTDYPSVYRQYNQWSLSAVGEMGFNLKLGYNTALNLHLRGDYSQGDVENKSVAYRTTVNNQTKTVNFWEQYPGGFTRQATNSLNLGLLFGITYTFIREELPEESEE